MSSEPWFKFFPSDWLGGTAGLSASEKGVYVTLIASIYDAGGPLKRDDSRLARRCGLPKASFARALDSLIELGKIEFDGQCLHNSRAKSELSEREKKIDSAREGARVTNENKREKSKEAPRTSERTSDLFGVAEGSVRARGPEARDKIDSSSLRSDESSPKRVRAKIDYSELFEQFWSGYPTDPNMPKKEAWGVWQKLQPEDHAKAIKSLPGFRAYCHKHQDYRPVYADRYLSQRRFDGFVAAAAKTPASTERMILFAGGARFPESYVIKSVEKWKSNRYLWPEEYLGAPPGDQCCLVPDDILHKFGVKHGDDLGRPAVAGDGRPDRGEVGGTAVLDRV